MPFPDLVWTAGVIIGGLLLIDSLSLTKRGRVGVWVVFASFIFQVYWEITHPWVVGNSLPEVIVTTVIIVVGLSLMLILWLRRRKSIPDPKRPPS